MAVNDFIISNNRPRNFTFTNPSNALRKLDSSFYDICIVMEKAGTNNPTEQTVYQFYKRVEYYEKKYMKESVRK